MILHDAPRYVITLVHGTWAPNAAWAKPGSPLRSQVQSALGGQVRFRRVCWTGRNRHSDRADAALRTARRLIAASAADPEARHVVIAHSHGGNIVRLALQDTSVQQRIDGVVTMATPFIDCRRRDAALHLTILALIVSIVGGYLPIAIVAQIVVRAVGPGLDESQFWPGLFGLISLVAWVMTSRRLYRAVAPRLERWAAAAADRTVARLVGTATIATPFLCVGVTGDEASLGLGLAGWIADAPFRAATRIGALVERYWRVVLKVVWVLGIPLSLAGLADQRIGLMVLTAAAMLMIPGLTWPLMLVIPRIPWVAFGVGRERLSDSLFSRVFSTRTPPRCERCTENYFDPQDVLKMGRLRARLSGTLFHSSVYTAPAVTTYVSSWLRGLQVTSGATSRGGAEARSNQAEPRATSRWW